MKKKEEKAIKMTHTIIIGMTEKFIKLSALT